MIVLVLPNPIEDDSLLSRAKNGDKVAIGDIYRLYVDSIYQFCRLRLGDAQSAEDITSQVFTTFIQSLAKSKGPKHHLRGWLFKVARNAMYDTYGKQQTLPIETIEQWAHIDSIDPENAAFQAIDADMLRERITMLSPDQQDILLLRFDQQLSLQETADILGKKVNTVKALQFRAVNRLRELLQRAGMAGS